MRGDIRSDIWVKLWGNLAFNPVSALTGATLEDIARDAGTRAVVRAMMAEGQAVGEALGARFAIDVDKRIEGAEQVGAHRTSMLQDLNLGRPMEIEALVGVISRAGPPGRRADARHRHGLRAGEAACHRGGVPAGVSELSLNLVASFLRAPNCILILILEAVSHSRSNAIFSLENVAHNPLVNNTRPYQVCYIAVRITCVVFTKSFEYPLVPTYSDMLLKCDDGPGPSTRGYPLRLEMGCGRFADSRRYVVDRQAPIVPS